MSYYFSQPASNQQPYVYWANGPVTTPTVAALTLPAIFTTPLTSPLVSGSFTMTGVTTGNGLVYNQLAIAGGDVTTFDNTPIRSALRADVLAFLLALEAQGLTPGSLELVQQMLALYLPVTFTETLFYRYGFDPANGYVDLRPGMRLRFDFEAHQKIDPAPNDVLNGFVGSGTSYYEIAETASPTSTLLAGLDPFLASVVNPAVAPNTGGGGGAIDMHGQAFAYPYFRLFLPKSFSSADSTGSAGLGQSFVLFGATTRKDLEAATTSYLTTATFGSVSGVAATFRGRTVVTPEISMFLLGDATWVPIGTTVRHLVRRYAIVPRGLSPQTASFNLPSQFFSRPMTSFNASQTGQDWTLTWTFPLFVPGQFNFTTNSQSYNGGFQTYSNVLDSFDLPVTGGDDLSFGMPLTTSFT